MTDAMEKPVAVADPDAEVVQRAKAGDFTAFESLVSKYERHVFGVAMRIVRNGADAEEVVQETFMAMLEHIQEFSGRAPVRSWLMRIATNEALLILRKRRARNRAITEVSSDGLDDYASLPHPEFIARWKSDPSALAANSETREIIDKALDTLDEKYRLVFVLRDVEGFSTEETAKALAISVANVKVRLLRARLMLREQLTKVFGDPAQQMEHEH